MPRFFLFSLIFLTALASGCGSSAADAPAFPVIFTECGCERIEGEANSNMDYAFEGKNFAYQNDSYAFFLTTTLINKSSSRVRYVRNKALIESRNFTYSYDQEETFLIAPRDTAIFLLGAAGKLKTKSLRDTVTYAVPDTEAVSISLYLYTEPKGKVIQVKTSARIKLR